jgi:hypothetical protein
MCGGGNNKAADAANKAEDDRKQQVASATAAIDQAFSGRTGQLDDFANALREDFRADANQQKTVADRRLKFALARGGQTGGSLAVDQGRTLGKEFQKGLLKGERGVQGSLADLSSADEATRQNLIALAQGGAGIGSSAQAASRALQSNISGARASGLANDLGDIFSDTRGLFVKSEEAAARRKGLAESEVFADPFSRG